MREFAHDEDYTRLMSSKRWRTIRVQKLIAQPLCERCLASGVVTKAREVHHLQPIERGGSPEEKARRCYAFENLQSLCADCHQAAHDELKSHAPESIAATAAAETEAMKRALFEAGGVF